MRYDLNGALAIMFYGRIGQLKASFMQELVNGYSLEE